jgi:hypothetical protein
VGSRAKGPRQTLRLEIRFQADANLDPCIGQGLVRRQPRIDWSPASGVIGDGAPDPEVLHLSALAGRVLVTADVSTMIVHFLTYTAECSSPGLILIPPMLTIGETIERLLSLWSSSEPKDLENQVRWLDR